MERNLPLWEDQPKDNRNRYIEMADFLLERGYVNSSELTSEDLAKRIFKAKMEKKYGRTKST